jgi:hypothetical protein
VVHPNPRPAANINAANLVNPLKKIFGRIFPTVPLAFIAYRLSDISVSILGKFAAIGHNCSDSTNQPKLPQEFS